MSSAKEEEQEINKELQQSASSSNLVDIDDLLPYVGEFGRYQRFLELLFCISELPLAFQVLLPYFTQDNPSWKCAANSSTCRSKAVFTATDEFRCNLSRSDWTYTVPKDYSVATQFDLHCDKDTYAFIVTSAFFLSWAIGAVVLGWLSDRFGRFKILTLSQLVVLVGGLVGAFSPNFAFYAFFRALVGFFIPGVVVPLFVSASEIVGSKYRPLCGNLLWAMFAFGLIQLGTLAYFIRQWKYLVIVSTAPYLLMLPFYKFIPESIRWLRISGRTDEAMQILRKIAKFNNKKIPSHFVLSESKKEVHAPMIDIFRPKKMAISTVIQGYIWAVEAMVYYGVTLAADNLGGNNRYVNYILSSLVDFPCVLTAIYLCKKIGRKKTVGIPLFIGSILCIVVAFVPAKASATVPKHWPIIRVTLGLLGKFFATVSFDALYTWSAEIYPTVVRAEGMGFLQIQSRIGAALAPWVSKRLKIFHPALPFLIMGGTSLIASACTLQLPETRDMKTAETLEHDDNSNGRHLLPKTGEEQDKHEESEAYA